MAEKAALGKKLLAESKHQEAIEQFTAALKSSPTSPDYLIQRSTAYQRTKRYAEALKDAELAIIYAQQRAKREFIVQAQLRRGIALFNLERYGDAKLALGVVKRMDGKEKSVDLWLNKTETKLKTIPGDDEKAKVTISEKPNIDLKSASDQVSVSNSSTASSLPAGAATTSSAPAPSTATPQQTPIDKIRHEWYQNSDNVFFTLLAKGVPKEKATIDIGEASLGISFPVGSAETTYDFTIDPFFAHVDPEKSSTRVLSTKVEIILAKATPGQKWSTLEGKEPLVPQASATSTSENVPEQTVASKNNPAGPAYPTSSKSGPKNWDKIASENTKTDGEGEEDDDEGGGDDASRFFKKLFKGSSADTQRAMMKSYVESNGTALSTDWGEVSKGKVETVPPDGVEEKKW